MNRFQEFAYNWGEGELETPLVALESITQVPISFFVGTADTSCAYDLANEYIPRFNTQTTRIDVEGADHDYFRMKANSDWFMEQLVA